MLYSVRHSCTQVASAHKFKARCTFLDLDLHPQQAHVFVCIESFLQLFGCFVGELTKIMYALNDTTCYHKWEIWSNDQNIREHKKTWRGMDNLIIMQKECDEYCICNII